MLHNSDSLIHTVLHANNLLIASLKDEKQAT